MPLLYPGNEIKKERLNQGSKMAYFELGGGDITVIKLEKNLQNCDFRP